MSRKSIFVSTALLLLVVATTSFAQDKYQWKLEDTDDGCQIYTSPVAGMPYIAAKTICTVNARIDVIGYILRDVENFKEWMDDCKDTKMLKVIDDEKDVFIFWLRQHIPLLTDRDVVLKTEVNITPEKSVIKTVSTNEIPYDTDKGYVRMPSMTTEYTLEWVDKDHTKVTFMINPDLGKGLPKGISNSQIKKNPFKSIKGLKKMVKEQKYIDGAKTSKYAKLVDDAIKAGTLK
jgi:START domain.